MAILLNQSPSATCILMEGQAVSKSFLYSPFQISMILSMIHFSNCSSWFFVTLIAFISNQKASVWQRRSQITSTEVAQQPRFTLYTSQQHSQQHSHANCLLCRGYLLFSNRNWNDVTVGILPVVYICRWDRGEKAHYLMN